MAQWKEQQMCIRFCANLGKSAAKTLTMIQQAFGDQSLSCARVFQWHAHFKTRRTSVDDDKRTEETKKLHNYWNCCTNSRARPSGSTSDHSHCWEGGNWLGDMPTGSDGRIGHAPFRSQICAQDPDSWPEATSALKFVSSPPMMKPSCPRSSLVMRAGFTVRTLRQSNNPPSGKVPRHQGQKRPDRWKAMSRAWSTQSLTSRGLCTKNLSQQAKLWIAGSTAMFCDDSVKTCKDVAPNCGKNRPGCFTMTTPRLTLPSSPSSFWQKTKWLSSPTHHIPLIWHPVTSSFFQKWNWSWKDARLIQLRRYKQNRRECLTLW